MTNVVILLGRLVADPELRSTQQGTSVASFRIAVDRDYKQGGQRQADFITCTAWRQSADFVSRYFKKGSPISVVGSLQSRSYQDNKGETRYITEVVVDRISFVPGTKAEGGQTTASAPAAYAPQEAVPMAFSQGGADGFTVIDGDEDLPF